MNKQRRMSKKQFRIGQLATELDVKKYVIRFWEKEFNLSADRSTGGQRFYTTDDLHLFRSIKHLLYNKGFTIAGARQELSKRADASRYLPSLSDKSETTDIEKTKRALERALKEANGLTAENKVLAAENQKLHEQLEILKAEFIKLKALV